MNINDKPANVLETRILAFSFASNLLNLQFLSLLGQRNKLANKQQNKVTLWSYFFFSHTSSFYTPTR